MKRLHVTNGAWDQDTPGDTAPAYAPSCPVATALPANTGDQPRHEVRTRNASRDIVHDAHRRDGIYRPRSKADGSLSGDNPKGTACPGSAGPTHVRCSPWMLPETRMPTPLRGRKTTNTGWHMGPQDPPPVCYHPFHVLLVVMRYPGMPGCNRGVGTRSSPWGFNPTGHGRGIPAGIFGEARTDWHVAQVKAACHKMGVA